MNSADLISLLPGTTIHVADRGHALIGAALLPGVFTAAIASRRAYLNSLHTDVFEPKGPALAYQIAGSPQLTRQGNAFAAFITATSTAPSPLPSLRQLARQHGARLLLHRIHPDRLVFHLPTAQVSVTSAGQVHVTPR